MTLKWICKSIRTWIVFSNFHVQIVKQYLLFTVATSFGLKVWPKLVAAVNNMYIVQGFGSDSWCVSYRCAEGVLHKIWTVLLSQYLSDGQL